MSLLKRPSDLASESRTHCSVTPLVGWDEIGRSTSAKEKPEGADPVCSAKTNPLLSPQETAAAAIRESSGQEVQPREGKGDRNERK